MQCLWCPESIVSRIDGGQGRKVPPSFFLPAALYSLFIFLFSKEEFLSTEDLKRIPNIGLAKEFFLSQVSRSPKRKFFDKSFFGKQVFLSQVSRSPKQKFFDKSFFSQVSRSRGRRVEWVLRMFDCQMEPGNSITKTPPLSSNKKGAHSLY